ncbi:hypothetical protein IHQ68_11135 [Chelatococcus sambhunathii]|uniref:Uncharacterized protein n=1 Tax=Chelatococcus sambhunathii TaxID=363953 RepID=A0ABU1DGB2_9HYPH|nr:hypothetical protein [Chelatococcus sambhunathii]MDR4307173.1 hypothetical protein [Chelatococcus sambhunathii]
MASRLRAANRWALVALSAALAGGAAALAYYFAAAQPAALGTPAPVEIKRRSSLYCQFYVFVESRPFVAFLMEQAQDDTAVFRQIYVAKADGDRTDYNAETGVRPEWRLDAASVTPRLEARVVVPDTGQSGLGEQDIAIEFPGARREDFADRGSTRWREASLKSVYYQNLPGKCRRQQTP